MKSDDKIKFSASQVAAFLSFHEALSTNEVMTGMDLFNEAAKNLEDVRSQTKKGNLYEYIESAKYNVDAAEKGIDFRSKVTAADGRPQDAADVEIYDNKSGELLNKHQLKSSIDPSRTNRQFDKDKYDGMDKVTHPEHSDEISGAKGAVEYGGASSEGTSLDEVIFATEHPKLFSSYLESVQLMEEGISNAGYAAIAGALVKGSIGLVQSGFSLNDDNIKNEIILSAKNSALIGSSGTVIRYGANNLNIDALSHGNVATAFAACTIGIGKILLLFNKGKISGVEAIEGIGQNGISTLSSVYAGLSIGSVAGPVGALIGTVGGYLVSSSLYQSTLAIAREAEMQKNKYDLLEAIYDESCRSLEWANKKYKLQTAIFKVATKRNVNKTLTRLENGLVSYNSSKITNSLSKLSLLTGKGLGFDTFEKFLDEMESENPIVI